MKCAHPYGWKRWSTTVMSPTIAHDVFQCFCLIEVYDIVGYKLQDLVFL